MRLSPTKRRAHGIHGSRRWHVDGVCLFVHVWTEAGFITVLAIFCWSLTQQSLLHVHQRRLCPTTGVELRAGVREHREKLLHMPPPLNAALHSTARCRSFTTRWWKSGQCHGHLVTREELGVRVRRTYDTGWGLRLPIVTICWCDELSCQ